MTIKNVNCDVSRARCEGQRVVDDVKVIAGANSGEHRKCWVVAAAWPRLQNARNDYWLESPEASGGSPGRR